MSKPDCFAHPAPLELRGRHVLLRPIDPQRDAAALYEASHGSAEKESVWRYMLSGPYASAEAMRDHYVEKFGKLRDPLGFTVVRLSDNRAIGMTALMATNTEHGRTEIGHVWFGIEAQRSAANTESQYLLLRYVFEDLGYRRVEWKCDGRNALSRAAALRLGFSFEGRFRHHMQVRGENRDTEWFAIVDSDWPERRARLEQMLASRGDSRSD